MQNIDCVCKKRFTGLFCKEKISCGNSENTECTGTQRCDTCLSGWVGPICTKKKCEYLKICGKHGKKLIKYRKMATKYY